MQRGYGLGSMLKGLLKSAIPIVKSGAKLVGKKALQTGLNVMRDVANGETISSATTSNLKKLGQQLGSKTTGKPKKRVKRKRLKKKPVSLQPAKRRRTSDIFDS